MIFWSYFSALAWIMLGVGVIFWVVQKLRHKPAKIALVVAAVGLIASVGGYAGFNYAAPTYGDVSIERANYELAQRVTKDGKALSKLGDDATDKQAYNGDKAAKDLIKVVKSIPETYDNHRQRDLVISGLPTFTDDDSYSYDSETIESLYRLSASVVSQKITPKDEGKAGQTKVFKQLVKDTGY